jgi:hypothetical protein
MFLFFDAEVDDGLFVGIDRAHFEAYDLAPKYVVICARDARVRSNPQKKNEGASKPRLTGVAQCVWDVYAIWIKQCASLEGVGNHGLKTAKNAGWRLLTE